MVTASEVINLYNKGKRDFRSESLRGESFKKANLANADFSEADIRGANFAYANLTGVKFSSAKAGLQRRWAISLLVASWAVSGMSEIFSIWIGFLGVLLFDIGNIKNVIAGGVSLIVLAAFSIVTVHKGLAGGFGTAVGATTIAMSVTVIVAGYDSDSSTPIIIAGVVAGSIAGAVAVIVIVAVVTGIAGKVAGKVAIFVTGVVAVAVVSTGSNVVILVAKTIAQAAKLSVDPAEVVTGTGVASVTLTLFGTYIGWRTLAGDERDAWIRFLAIAIAATGGTSFYKADLTDADFTNASLKSTDLRKATLTHTCWQNEDDKKLDGIRPGETYLKNVKLRQLVITRNGQGQKFDHLLNLKEVNLQEANLINADFTASDLSHANLQGANLQDACLIRTNLNAANLQDADLSRAKLVQAQLDKTDLTGATLTGAYIEDWNITTETILNGVRCDYIFMRLPDGTHNPNPHRKPDDWDKNFADGDFIDFITPMVQTLDLYHNKAVDPRLVAIAFHDLTEKHPDAELEIISIEKKGNNRDKLHIKAETSPQANPSLLHGDYFANLDELQSLPPAALEALLAERGAVIRMLVGLLETKHNSTEVSINNNQTQGNSNMSGDRTINTSGGNYNESGTYKEREINLNDQASYAEGDYYNSSQPQQTLAESAAEIQQLLDQLSQTYPTDTTKGKMAVAAAAIEQIENNHTLTERILGALKAGSIQALGQALNHPAASFVIGALEDWQKSKIE